MGDCFRQPGLELELAVETRELECPQDSPVVGHEHELPAPSGEPRQRLQQDPQARRVDEADSGEIDDGVARPSSCSRAGDENESISPVTVMTYVLGVITAVRTSKPIMFMEAGYGDDTERCVPPPYGFAHIAASL